MTLSRNRAALGIGMVALVGAALVLPIVVLLIGVTGTHYGAYATPSETAGLGGVLALVLKLLAVLLISASPAIALWLPNAVMG